MKEIYASPPIDVEGDEAAWFAFLGALERVSYKCLSQMKGDPRCHSWAGRWSTLRKEDPLLSFLSKSRGAEEHSHLEVVERGVGIRDFTRMDGPMQYKDVDGTLVPQVVLADKIHLDPMTVKLKPLEYRGKAYDVPKLHLGKRLLTPTPITRGIRHRFLRWPDSRRGEVTSWSTEGLARQGSGRQPGLKLDGMDIGAPLIVVVRRH